MRTKTRLGKWSPYLLLVISPFFCPEADGEDPRETVSAEMAAHSEVLRIKDVQVECLDPSNIDLALLRSHVALRKGEEWDPRKVDESLRALYQLEAVEKAEMKVQKRGEGEITVQFLVTARYKIRHITFKGNRRYKDRRLLSEIQSRPNGVLNPAKLTHDVFRLKRFYENKGYRHVRST
ncbi:MAG: hypothetical protein LBR62_02175, partial [Puniceicoccales bacterium]|nr:hypothetical protein [Puniceicoccales bacterium]